MIVNSFQPPNLEKEEEREREKKKRHAHKLGEKLIPCCWEEGEEEKRSECSEVKAAETSTRELSLLLSSFSSQPNLTECHQSPDLSSEKQ